MFLKNIKIWFKITKKEIKELNFTTGDKFILVNNVLFGAWDIKMIIDYFQGEVSIATFGLVTFVLTMFTISTIGTIGRRIQ